MLSTRLSILFVKMMRVNKSLSAPHSAHRMRTSIFTRVVLLRRSTAEFGRVRGVLKAVGRLQALPPPPHPPGISKITPNKTL